MSGIFGLSGAYDRNLSGLIPEKTRPTFREYGYVGGKRFPGAATSSIIERIDYSNDTQSASVRGTFLSSIRQAGAAGNSDYGYFAAGSPNRSQVDRIDYSNETTSIPANLSSGTAYGRMAIGNSNFAYWGGSYTSGTPKIYRTQLERIEYSNDFVSPTLRGFLPTITRMGPASLSRNNDFGYYASGFDSGNGISATVARLPYANDTITMLFRGNLNTARRLVGQGTGNSNFGYIAGTNDSTSGSEVDRIDYSNDTATAIQRGNLTIPTTNTSATGNSNFGYISGGGGGTAPSPFISDVQRIDYSNDTVLSTTRGPLSESKYEVTATSSASFGGAPNSQYGVFAEYPYGYFIGGSFNGAAAGAKVNRLSFDNDTANASERGSLTNNVAGGAAVSSSNYFYSISGYSASGGALSFVERQDFSNDTSTATVRSRTSLARGDLAAEGNSSYGWIGGGGPNFGAFPYYSTIDRIDYSNDSVNARLRSFLTLARLRTSATGTSNFGYFGAGSFSTASPFLTKRVDRLNHSNDTINPLIRGDLFTLATKRAGTGTANFGYFGGGYSVGGSGAQTSAIDRIDYSNDTATAIQRASILVGRGGIGATGDNNKGYFGGGDQYANGFPYYSTIERLDYSNDTQTQLRSILYDNPVFGQPSLGRTNLSATSALEFGGAKDFQATQTFFDIQSVKSISDTTNYSVKKRALGSFGYFGAGLPVDSIVNRIDYSNDLSTASVRGPLIFPQSGIRWGFGVGNSNFGYFGGGYGSSNNTSTHRIDYSNDSSVALRRGDLNGTHNQSGSSGTENFGYSAIGITVRKINYSNDLSTISQRGNLSSGTSILDATGNKNFGYFAGGRSSPATPNSRVQRIDYSNDGVSASVRGPLSSASYGLAAAGNDAFGYFVGGTTGPSLNIRGVRRIDYSNDTVTTSERSLLQVQIYWGGGTGNSNFGYFGGGFPGPNSRIQRIDYSNDTAGSLIVGNLSSAIGRHSATTNARNS